MASLEQYQELMRTGKMPKAEEDRHGPLTHNAKPAGARKNKVKRKARKKAQRRNRR